MTFDVCFAAYNSEKWLKNCIKAIAASCYDLKKINLYFADNGSTDNTVAAIQKLQNEYTNTFGSFELLLLKDNKGFGSASNAGARAGKGDIVLFLNIDTEIHSDAFTKLADEIKKSDTKFGAFEMRQFPYEHPKYYDPITMEVSWASGACFALKREVFEKTGGFDESIFMYGEDVDLSWHIQLLGYKIKYVPSAVVTHYAYTEAGEEKPVQAIGSLAAMMTLRYKYGTKAQIKDGEQLWEDAIEYRKSLLSKKQSDAKQKHHKAIVKGAVEKKKELESKKTFYQSFYKEKVENSAFKPGFTGYDYEFVRRGAFYESHLPSTSPEFTLIIRTYKRPALLAMTLDSLRNQTYKNFKVIVVEDGENPTAQKVVEESKKWLDISYIPANAPWGRSKAGNMGIAAAATKYICFLDDDDYFFAEHLEVMACLAEENPDCEFLMAGSIAASCKIIGNDPTKFKYTNKRSINGKEVKLIDFFTGNPASIQSIVFTKNLFDTLGGLDEELDALEDWDLWIRYLSHAKKLAYVDKDTSIFKIPAEEKEILRRDKIISSYRPQVFEKMKNYSTEFTANDIFGLFWQPPTKKELDEQEELKNFDEKELRRTAEEIYNSTSWKITKPLRFIPLVCRFCGWWSLQLFAKIIWLLQKLLQLPLSFFSWLFMKMCKFFDFVGPNKPDFELDPPERIHSFILLARRSFSMKVARSVQKLMGKKVDESYLETTSDEEEIDTIE